MKKLLLLAVVALPLLFTSCTKPEDELFGTWRNVEENVTLDLSETKFGKRFFIDYGKSFGGSWDYLQSTNEVYCIPDVENPDFSSLSFIKVGDRLFWKGEDLYLDKI